MGIKAGVDHPECDAVPNELGAQSTDPLLLRQRKQGMEDQRVERHNQVAASLAGFLDDLLGDFIAEQHRMDCSLPRLDLQSRSVAFACAL